MEQLEKMECGECGHVITNPHYDEQCRETCFDCQTEFYYDLRKPKIRTYNTVDETNKRIQLF